MPAMDNFRTRWEAIELDLISGFHPDPIDLLAENRADLVIVSHRRKRPDVAFHPLFTYEMLGVLGNGHALERKLHLAASDYVREVLIIYSVRFLVRQE